MDEGDEPQAARLRRHHLSKIGEGEAVDNRLGAIGEAGERRRVRLRMPHRKFDDPDTPAPRTQTLDDVTVEQISAGDLIEPARDDKHELGHPSGASSAAQATTASRSTTPR